MFAFIFRVLLFWGFWTSVQARTEVGDPSDSLEKKPLPLYFTVGFDVSRPALGLIRSGVRAAEASLDIRKGMFLWEAHLGFSSNRHELARYEAFSRGPYACLGISRTLFQEQENVLAFGFRFAASRFTYSPEQVQIRTYPAEGTDRPNLPSGNQSAAWAEFVSGIRTRLYGWVYMGFEIRLKARLFQDKSSLSPYFIPGYGLAEKGFNPGFNYFIFVQIPGRVTRASKTDQNIP